MHEKICVHEFISVHWWRTRMSKKISIALDIILILTFILTFVLAILKLIGVVSWSWIWVTSPIWIHLGLCLLIIFVVCLFIGYFILFRGDEIR